ncbi:MAG TPA: hypothetical protein VMH87_06985 [Pseudomonadales bacterium]|nr:hypothetical protein [Pseudomonadales bacterium]
MNIIDYRLIRSLFASVFLSAGLFAVAAKAHDVWIEDTPDNHLVIRFGEFGDELETSPGYLDSLTQPQAWTKKIGADPAAFEVQKQTNSFLLAGAAITNMAAAETAFEVLSATNKPSRLPLFYARWQPAGAGAGTPMLTFDLVPQEKLGDIRVYFRGKPLADETVSAYGPANFTKELKTDANGFVHFDLSAPGFYLFTCNHYREDRFGYSGGRPYDLVSHNASLTLRVADTNKP